MKTPNYIHYVTMGIGGIGIFLEVANTYAPFIAQYIPNLAPAGKILIGFALVTKQALMLIEKRLTPPSQ